MTVRLSTTVNNIDKTVSNSRSRELVLRFYEFMKISGTSENDIIRNLVKLFFDNQDTILDEETNKKIVSEAVNKHPLSSAVSSQNYTTIGPSSSLHGNTDNLSSEVKTAILHNINFFDSVICKNVIDLESRKKLTATGIKAFFNFMGSLIIPVIFW